MACPYKVPGWRRCNAMYEKTFGNKDVDYDHVKNYCNNNNATNSCKCPCFGIRTK